MIKQIAKWILKEELIDLNLKIEELNHKIEYEEKGNILKEYYNNKYPKQEISYRRTDKDTIKIDVRQFLNKHNFELPKFTGTDDQIALNSLKWVIYDIKYVRDKSTYGLNEYWAFPYETLHYKKGDCEDGALLLGSIMLKNGIPSWKIRIVTGYVQVGTRKEGHAYVVYYSQPQRKWIILDWCYWPNKDTFDKRKDYKDEEKYKDIWFSFNDKYAWGKTSDLRKRGVKKVLQ